MGGAMDYNQRDGEESGLLEDRGAGKYGTCAVVLVYLVVGSLLMATYVWGIVTLNDRYGSYGAMRLWGRLYSEPENKWLLHVYYGSILAATVGFFPSLGYALKVAPRLTP